MNVWWFLAIMSGMGLAGRNVLFKMAGVKIDSAVAALVLSLSMSAVAIVYYLYQRTSAKLPLIPGEQTPQGLALACVAGFSLAAANIFLAYTYKAGGNAGLTGIIQNGVSLGLTILIGCLFLGETMRPLQMAGMAAAVLGIFLIVKG
ncbi:MAG: EamA family transporter [Alphaproteobacteria bacterium]|nr:EamA family transporter [Alphaproteobacteria bacterium]